jgi:formylglycine-generating enzyme required for sulfatase activity
MRDVLPILVRLREFSDAIPSSGQFATGDLEAAIARFVVRGYAPDLDVDTVNAHLLHGRVLLMLDGIDELPLAQRHLLLGALVHDAMDQWRRRGHRLLITGRPYALTFEEESALALDRAPIQKLDRARQELLVRRWQPILSAATQQPPTEPADLLKEITRHDHLSEFATNPLLLTALCIVRAHDRHLPQDRHELYDQIVNTVLRRRFPVERDRTRIRRNLAAVAHGMHTGSGLLQSRDVPQSVVTGDEIEHVLGATHEQVSSADKNTCAHDDSRRELVSSSGLLKTLDGQLAAFTHPSIQDFLAAEHVARTQHGHLVDVFLARSVRPEWHRTLAFVVRRLSSSNVQSDSRPAEALIEELINQDQGSGLQLVVADAVDVLLSRGIQLNAGSRARAADGWRRTMAGDAPARDRCRLGDALSSIGDPRFRADAWSLPDDELWGFVEVPEGSFRMGSEPRDRSALPDESPATVHVPRFYVGRFPVTVEQFSGFIKSASFKVGAPDCLRGVANHPVVWVSWHEAMAYCRWLTRQLRASPSTPLPLAKLLRDANPRWHVTLLSEPEWEKTARGPARLIYPYGDRPDVDNANVAEVGIGTTSAVGCFGRGASPYGVLDMSGNVWEWTRSAYRPREYDLAFGRDAAHVTGPRVVRGGSFVRDIHDARAAARACYDARVRNFSIGFRLALSPFSPRP